MLVRAILAALLVTSILPSTAQNSATGDLPLSAPPQDLVWFRDARYGFFICWGPVSLSGGDIGWSRAGHRPEPRGWTIPSSIPVEVYDNLYKQFNPTRYDPTEWMQLARDAGMKYVVFLTRHHDGFSLFDTTASDYSVMESPYGKDVTKQLADACHAAGLKLGFYYSQPDWHHPDYRNENHDRFIDYVHEQVQELCTNYGKVDIIWFDGLGGKPEDWRAEELFRMIRELQPGIIINNRCGLPGDFYTPEQRVGGFDRERPWESCITLGTQWSYKPDDTVKSLRETVHLLVNCAGGDGNLLLDVGPMPDGHIDPRQAARLREAGAWLNRHGESIYGTRGGPWMPAPWGVSTCTGSTIYLHVLEPERSDGELRLPPMPLKIKQCSLFSGGKVEWSQDAEGVRIALPKELWNEIDTLLRLEVAGDASALVPIPVPSGSLTAGCATVASATWENMPRYAGSKATDDNLGTRWGAADGDRSGWIEVDLGAPVRFNKAVLYEYARRVGRYELQYRDGEAWITFARGEGIGKRKVLRFAPVEVTRVRLNILEASDVPTLYEFQLFMEP